MSKSFSFALAALLTPLAAVAGAWLQPEGKGLLITQATYYSTNSFYDENGDIQPQSRYTKYELQPYVEYGLFSNVTVGTSAYLQQLSQAGVDNRGIADPELFAKWQLWSQPGYSLALQPLLKFSSHYARDNSPRGGSRSTDMELSLLYGQNIRVLGKDDYLDLRFGYRSRNRNLSDQIRADAVMGLKITPQLELAPAMRVAMVTRMPENVAFSESGDLDSSLMKAELTGIYHLNSQQWLQATFFSHVAGRQTGDGSGISLGFAQRF